LVFVEYPPPPGLLWLKCFYRYLTGTKFAYLIKAIKRFINVLFILSGAELYHQGRLWGSEELTQKANRYQTESCDRLDQLRGPD